MRGRPLRRAAVLMAACLVLMGACLVLMGADARAQGNALPAALREALRQAQLPAEALALAVLPADDPRAAPALLWQPDRSMAPASTMKVLTTVVALDRLGPNHRGSTEVWTQAPLVGERGDVLMGDVVLRGGADPDLDLPALWQLLAELRWQGVREIAGDIVLDRNLFQPARMDVGLPPFDEQPEAPYNMVPDALQLGGNLLRLELKADALGVVQARSLPELPLLQVDASELKPTARACSRWDDDWKSPPRLEARSDGSLRVVLQGGFPRGCSTQAWLHLIDRNALAERLLRWVWASLGGVWNGTVREAVEPTVGPWDPPTPPLANLLPLGPPRGLPPPKPLAGARASPPAPATVPAALARPGAMAVQAPPVADSAVAPPVWRRLAQHSARPWGELLRPMNKRSDNVLARLLYLELGRVAEGFDARAGQAGSLAAAGLAAAEGEVAESAPPAAALGVVVPAPAAAAAGGAPPERSASRADRVVRQWLAEQGIASEGLVTDNGSGLSRTERATARQLARALQVGHLGRWSPELWMSLPVAGIDGTLWRRLRDSPAGGSARLKTGALRDAVALAGFVRDGQGRAWAVAAMVNHPQAGRGRAVLDTVVDWLARDGMRGHADLNPPAAAVR